MTSENLDILFKCLLLFIGIHDIESLLTKNCDIQCLLITINDIESVLDTNNNIQYL